MEISIQKNKPSVPILVGPTASGKTKLSILLAQKIKSEIVSADSRQIYKFLDIGTAKPSPEIRNKIKHHFIDILNPNESYNAHEFSVQARKTIKNISGQGKTAVVVGGSGMYIQALVDGFSEIDTVDLNTRTRLQMELEHKGMEFLFNKLRKVDPATADKIDPKNPRRIIRALEVYETAGRPLSTFLLEKPESAHFEPIFIGLHWQRNDLYRNIDQRVQWMIDQGLIEEVESLKKMGFSRDLNSLQTVGYRETFEFLEKKITVKSKLINAIRINTRHYAKRQLTWFRKESRITWFSIDDRTDWNKIVERICGQFPKESHAFQ